MTEVDSCISSSQISGNVPTFFPVVADRIWNFSWKSEGFSLEHVSAGLAEIIANESFPFGIVAHDDERYLGSTLGIASDLDERRQYGPWVAAVWVEPQYRRQHVGRSLVSYATQVCFEQGFDPIYLCARADRRDFYARQGWIALETEVGAKQLTVFVRSKNES